MIKKLDKGELASDINSIGIEKIIDKINEVIDYLNREKIDEEGKGFFIQNREKKEEEIRNSCPNKCQKGRECLSCYTKILELKGICGEIISIPNQYWGKGVCRNTKPCPIHNIFSSINSPNPAQIFNQPKDNFREELRQEIARFLNYDLANKILELPKIKELLNERCIPKNN